MKKSSIIILKKESYLAMINNAVGSKSFRNLYALVDGEKEDILSDGDLSCAFFVSSILHQFNLIASPHSTVSGLERDLKESGWNITKTPGPGDVLIWEPKEQNNGEVHSHAGFFINDEDAISNSDKEKAPVKHHITFGIQPSGGPVRGIMAIYTRDFTS